jgi:LysM repeat protein
MNLKKHTYILFFLCSSFMVQSQTQSREEYIEKYKDIAIKKMAEYKIPASITLAQGILESGNGNSRLARKANNHFGIKCHKDWTGKTLKEHDDERNECFRKYSSAEDSYRDHSVFLTTRDRYAQLFKLEITDYKGWAKELKKAGYATNPKYPQLLIKIIEENRLFQYDKTQVASKKPKTKITNKGKAYFPDISKLDPFETSIESRNVYKNNGIKYIVVEKGDDFWKIAEEFGIYAWQVYKYNELTKKYKLQKGQLIYLEKKPKKGDKAYHMVTEEDNMIVVSQQYGIRLKRLYKMNKMDMGSQPKIGQRLKLR